MYTYNMLNEEYLCLRNIKIKNNRDGNNRAHEKRNIENYMLGFFCDEVSLFPPINNNESAIGIISFFRKRNQKSLSSYHF